MTPKPHASIRPDVLILSLRLGRTGETKALRRGETEPSPRFGLGQLPSMYSVACCRPSADDISRVRPCLSLPSCVCGGGATLPAEDDERKLPVSTAGLQTRMDRSLGRLDSLLSERERRERAA